MGLAFAKFMRMYGGDTYRGWPQTRDGVIPWGLFWLLYAAIPPLMAHDRVNATQATSLGQALVEAPKEQRDTVRRLMRDEIVRAGLDPDDGDDE